MTWKRHGYDAFLRRPLTYEPDRGNPGSLAEGDIQAGDQYTNNWDAGDINLGDTVFGDNIFGDNNTYLGPLFEEYYTNTTQNFLDIINLFGEKKDRLMLFFKPGTIAIGANVSATLTAKEVFIVRNVKLVSKTGPAGADLIIDLNVDGVSIWESANRAKILAGATEGETATVDYPVLPKNADLTLDIDQVGSSTAGADLTVQVLLEPYQ